MNTADEHDILKWFALAEGVEGAPGLDLPALDVAAVAEGYGVPSRKAEGESNPAKSRCKIVRSVEDNILYKVRVHCQQCETPACVSVCPAGALSEDLQGVKVVDEKKCLGCRLCEVACPVGAIFVVADRGVAVKCDLCRGLDEPQCVKFCFAGALQYVAQDKAGMTLARARSVRMLQPQHVGAQ